MDVVEGVPDVFRQGLAAGCYAHRTRSGWSGIRAAKMNDRPSTSMAHWLAVEIVSTLGTTVSRV